MISPRVDAASQNPSQMPSVAFFWARGYLSCLLFKKPFRSWESGSFVWIHWFSKKNIDISFMWEIKNLFAKKSGACYISGCRSSLSFARWSAFSYTCLWIPPLIMLTANYFDNCAGKSSLYSRRNSSARYSSLLQCISDTPLLISW